MKKLLLLFVAIATLMNIACENSINESIIVDQMAEISVVAEADAEEDSRVALNSNTTTWEVGDCITVALIKSQSDIKYTELKIVSSDDISSNGKRATFRGSAPEGNYLRVMAIYPAVANPSANITLDREAENNLYMKSYSSNELTITADSKASIPLSFSHMMHKMDFNLSLANGYHSNDLESNDIAVEISATNNEGAVKFAKTTTLNIIQDYTSVASTTTTVLVKGSGSAFSTMLFPMGSSRDVAFTFGVYIDGEKRYEIRKPDGGSLSTFTMSAGKTTTVNLVLSNENNVAGGGVEAEPITLKASKTTIKANGTDGATLSVVKTNGGEDVTAEATIYVNGSLHNGTSFKTTTAGAYTLYAERNGARSANITIVAEEVGNIGKNTIFADGVTMSSGWYDVNKKSTPSTPGADAMMCWAASSSNIIQWFQDRYVAAGNTLPSGCPNGTSSKYDYELQIMDAYRDNWENLARGSWTDGGVIWYFEGRDIYSTMGSEGRAYPKSGSGGYFKSKWSSIYPSKVHQQDGSTYAREINNYNWRSGISDPLKAFSNYIVEAFEYGMSSMAVAISSNFSGGHAVTIWGYEIDSSTGYVTKLYIADSDDGSTPVLQTYNVTSDNSNAKIKLSGYTTYYPFALYPISGYGSAGK